MLAVPKERKKKRGGRKKEKRRKPGEEKLGLREGTKDRDSISAKDVCVCIPYTLAYVPRILEKAMRSRRGSVLGRSRNGETLSEA